MMLVRIIHYEKFTPEKYRRYTLIINYYHTTLRAHETSRKVK